MGTATDDLTIDVAAMRHALDLTQQAMGDVLGVNRRTIDRWEHGGQVHVIWQERLRQLWFKMRPRQPLPTMEDSDL